MVRSIAFAVLFLFATGANASIVYQEPPRDGFCGEVDEMAGKVAGVGAGIATVAGSFELGVASAGAAAVAHSSKALILTQGGSYVAGTLGAVGPAAIAAAPFVLGAGLFTLAGAGTAMLYCDLTD